MSLELKDFRGRITLEADCALDAEARITGRERQEIVREILHEWAVRKIETASVLHRLLLVEGLEGISGVGTGRARE